MQITFDLNLNIIVRSRDQTFRHVKNRKKQKTKRQQNQQLFKFIKQIQFKHFFQQYRCIATITIDIRVQKQFIVRHFLFQYIFEFKNVQSIHHYAKHFIYNKFFISIQRFTYDVYYINKFLSFRQQHIIFQKQKNQ